MNSKQIIQLRESLLSWYDKDGRILPWRENTSPYYVWLSEIMLQQTQVKTVLSYFESWIDHWPSIDALSQAEEDEVLKVWQGLGYYQRARNLLKGAKMIVTEWKGHFPEQFDEVIRLPGVGRSTAGAILSIAFNQAYPVLDGNVKRTLSRLLDDSRRVSDSSLEKDFFKLLHEWIDPIRPGDFNQATMEMGAKVCLPKNPKCDQCPLRLFCQAFEKGTVELRPVKSERKKVTSIRVVVALMWDKEGRVFIQKRPPKGLFAGLWEFPGGKVEKGETLEKALLREIQEELGVFVEIKSRFIRLIHHYTRFKVTLYAYHCIPAITTMSTSLEHQWVSPKKLKDFPFPAANKQITDRLLSL